MINYCTYVNIPRPAFEVSYRDRLMFVGSCFADQIGTRMKEHGWDACVNPYGVLYNPSSIAAGCERLLQPEPFTENDLFEYDGMFHSFKHHSQFSGGSAAEALTKMNDALSDATSYLSAISFLFITFGTASVYCLKSDGRTLANCHKAPASRFDRELLTVNQIVDEWSVLLEKIRLVNASLRVIFTVSPIRHWKDGAHANQISKSVLLLAEQALTEQYSGWTTYFPAYELMMDELRDYRFYADDMLHPSMTAMDYIWERFLETYMDEGAKEDVKEVQAIRRNIQHRPFNPSSDAYKRFLQQTLITLKRLQEKKPYICMANEEKEIVNRMSKYL